MAVLRSGDLSFDIRYSGYKYGGIQYEFYFCWKNEPIVKDSMLNKEGAYWGKRPESSFLADNVETDVLLPLFNNVLKSDVGDYLETTDPDLIIALYPDIFFPFLPFPDKTDHRNDINKEKKPDDYFTILVSVDAHNFKDAKMYYGQGLALHMIVKRCELEKFAEDLEREYEEFKKNTMSING